MQHDQNAIGFLNDIDLADFGCPGWQSASEHWSDHRAGYTDQYSQGQPDREMRMVLHGLRLSRCI
jgi:hypothetical protein